MQSPNDIKSAYLRIGTRCNATCVMCDFWREPASEMPRGTVLQVLHRLAQQGYSEVIVTGGEPLLAECLPLALSVCSDLGLRASMISNGSMLSSCDALNIRFNTFHRCFLSVDSPSSETHDAIRGIACFDSLDAWLSSNLNGPQIVINTVLSKLNEHNVLQLPEWMSCHGVSVINVINMKHPRLALAPAVAASLMRTLLQACETYGIRHYVTSTYDGMSCSEALACLEHPFPSACLVSDRCVFVEVDAHAYPCNCSSYGGTAACTGNFLGAASSGDCLKASSSTADHFRRSLFPFCPERCDLSNRLLNYRHTRQTGESG